jgi:hypothetical protein
VSPQVALREVANGLNARSGVLGSSPSSETLSKKVSRPPSDGSGRRVDYGQVSVHRSWGMPTLLAHTAVNYDRIKPPTALLYASTDIQPPIA